MSQNSSNGSSSRTHSDLRHAISSWKPIILIAEDDSDSREMMQLLLETRGFNVVSAENGIRALEVALQVKPDAVLIDLELPKLDGLSVTRNLRLHPAFNTLPIVIVSGHDPSRYRRDALDAGCDATLIDCTSCSIVW
jgi:chemosensory pili system protein ChpA (sensor histidine kinase/response regulator)